MSPADLAAAVTAAIRAAVDAGDLAADVPADVPLTAVPGADFASPVALRLGADDPLLAAQAIAKHLGAAAGIAAVEVSPPGFLTITLTASALGETARAIVLAGATPLGGPAARARGHLAAPALDLAVHRPAGLQATSSAARARTLQATRPADHEAAGRHTAAQFVGAQAASVLRWAADLGVEPVDPARVDVGLLTGRQEVAVLRALAGRPVDPRRVPAWLDGDLVPAAERFFDEVDTLPRSDDPADALTHARLLLWQAVRIVVVDALALLGTSAPERL